MLFALGLILTAAAALFLLAGWLRAEKAAGYPAYGWAGLAVIALAEALLFGGVGFVSIYFTPIVWTGYILAADAAVYSLRGRSMLRFEPRALLWTAVLSICLWLIFEAYNVRLVNWTYVGLPRNEYLRYLGYGWSFATIWPCILETAQLLQWSWFRSAAPPPAPPEPRRALWGWIAAGLVLVTVPVLVPRNLGVYLFGAVWLGFIFLADPLNYRARRPSITGDLLQGYRARLWSLLLAGAVCGFFWEFWNYWASAKWLYIFPILEQYPVFEMPVLGYLGFPAFALEVFALYVWAASALNLPRDPELAGEPERGAGLGLRESEDAA